MNIDKKLGPLRIRAWLLMVNFCFNAIAIYGLSRLMVEGYGWPILGVGVGGSLVCLGLLSQPSGQEEGEEVAEAE